MKRSVHEESKRDGPLLRSPVNDTRSVRYHSAVWITGACDATGN